MQTISAFEAKTHFSQLLRRVEQGEEFEITRHGKPVAKLYHQEVAVKSSKKPKKKVLMSEIKGLLAGKGITLKEMLEWRREGLM